MITALLLAAARAPVPAASPPAAPPPAIVARVAAELGGAAIPPGMIRAVDVDGDDLPDWQVDYEKAGETRWCGTGGCRYQLYVARRDGDPLLAFDEIARDLSVRRGRVTVDVYGSYCGSYGADVCPRAFTWRAADARLVVVADPRQQPRLFGPLFQPLVIDRAAWPATVAQVVDQRRRTCADAGGTLDEAAGAVVRAPDLDGDGREDWIVGSPWSACAPPDGATGEMPRPTLVALVGERPAVAFEGMRGDYLVDISTAPATLMLIPDEETRLRRCPGRPTRCAVRPLRWDAAARRLVPAAAGTPRSREAPRTGPRRAR